MPSGKVKHFRSIEEIDSELAKLKIQQASHQEEMRRLYLEGLTVLGKPYTEDVQNEWEPIILAGYKGGSSEQNRQMQLDVLDAAYGFARSGIDEETSECGLLVQKPMQKLWHTVKAEPPKTSGGSA